MRLQWFAFFWCVWLTFSIHAQENASIRGEFKRADGVAYHYRNHSLQDLRQLAHRLTFPFHTEKEKFRTIYKWVCDNIEMDYDDFLESKRMRDRLKNDPKKKEEWNRKFSKQLFQKLIKHHRTICTGYSYLLRELATLVGLKCVMIDGYGRTAAANVGGEGVVNHSWNAVQLDGKWFLCDPTWSSGAIDGRTRQFLKRYDDAYFLAAPEVFVRNHYPIDTAWMMISKQKPTLQQFLNRPVVYRAVYDHHISALLPDTIALSAVRGQAFNIGFRMDCSQPIENVGLVISDSNGSSSPVSVELKNDGQGNFHVDPIITSRGSYLMHLLFDDQYAVTYRLRVR